MKLFQLLGMLLVGLYATPANAGCSWNIEYFIISAKIGSNVDVAWRSSSERVTFLANSECNSFSSAVRSGRVSVSNIGDGCTVSVAGLSRSTKIIGGKSLQLNKSPGAKIPSCRGVEFGVRFK